jgi:hypothetical protein
VPVIPSICVISAERQIVELKRREVAERVRGGVVVD